MKKYLIVCILIAFVSLIHSRNNKEKIDLCSLDRSYIFKDSTWFLPFTDVPHRDSTRAVYEQWEAPIEGGCFINLTLFKDSTYTYKSPCEWEDEIFYGVYWYCMDTLFTFEFGSTYDYEIHGESCECSLAFKALYKYIRNDKGYRLKALSRQDAFNTTLNENNLIFYNIRY